MSNWIFVGPILLSGIGQVMHKYAQLFKVDYITFGDDPPPSDKNVFTFIIPQKETFDGIVKKFNPKLVMTVCETEPVHKDYSLIFDTFPLVLVPSEFCKNVFLKQFPNAHIEVFRHWCPLQLKNPRSTARSCPYTFYTIGNAIDPRKNINMLLKAFVACEFDNARLVIKATCKQDVKLNVPNVLVLNGLMSDEQIERIHESCDCYINCSFSEGVGMGAVEAAMKNKPVIITDYGGLKEYVNTPFIISTTETRVGFYDFLYEPHMKWGNPSFEELVKHMKFCYENNIRTWNHNHTVQLTSGSMLRTKFSDFSLALTGSSIEVSSLTDEDGSSSNGNWVLV